MSNKSLPVLNNISYSSLTDWNRCPWYFKVKNIDKVSDFSRSVETIYGTLIHKFVQEILLEDITATAASLKFNRIWKKFTGIYKKYITIDTSFALDSSELIFNEVQRKFKEWFGTYQVLAIEYKIVQPASEKWNQNFKGFIDIVLELSDGSIIIIDLKTSSSFYTFNRFKDKYKDYQIVLYKHFYSKQANMDLSKIRVYFVVLDKTKEPINLLPITSGNVKIKNALDWLNGGLSAINRNIYLKNRSNCQMYGKPCSFYKTKYCP
jgi:hypothetical protein